LQLVCEDRVLFVSVDLQVFLCSQLRPKWEQAIRLVYPPTFCKLRSSSNHANKNLTKLLLEIQFMSWDFIIQFLQHCVQKQILISAHVFVFNFALRISKRSNRWDTLARGVPLCRSLKQCPPRYVQGT
jgi:hypothetical protein